MIKIGLGNYLLPEIKNLNFWVIDLKIEERKLESNQTQKYFNFFGNEIIDLFF